MPDAAGRGAQVAAAAAAACAIVAVTAVALYWLTRRSVQQPGNAESGSPPSGDKLSSGWSSLIYSWGPRSVLQPAADAGLAAASATAAAAGRVQTAPATTYTRSAGSVVPRPPEIPVTETLAAPAHTQDTTSEGQAAAATTPVVTALLMPTTAATAAATGTATAPAAAAAPQPALMPPAAPAGEPAALAHANVGTCNYQQKSSVGRIARRHGQLCYRLPTPATGITASSLSRPASPSRHRLQGGTQHPVPPAFQRQQQLPATLPVPHAGTISSQEAAAVGSSSVSPTLGGPHGALDAARLPTGGLLLPGSSKGAQPSSATTTPQLIDAGDLSAVPGSNAQAPAFFQVLASRLRSQMTPSRPPVVPRSAAEPSLPPRVWQPLGVNRSTSWPPPGARVSSSELIAPDGCAGGGSVLQVLLGRMDGQVPHLTNHSSSSNTGNGNGGGDSGGGDSAGLSSRSTEVLQSRMASGMRNVGIRLESVSRAVRMQDVACSTEVSSIGVTDNTRDEATQVEPHDKHLTEQPTGESAKFDWAGQQHTLGEQHNNNNQQQQQPQQQVSTVESIAAALTAQAHKAQHEKTAHLLHLGAHLPQERSSREQVWGHSVVDQQKEQSQHAATATTDWGEQLPVEVQPAGNTTTSGIPPACHLEASCSSASSIDSITARGAHIIITSSTHTSTNPPGSYYNPLFITPDSRQASATASAVIPAITISPGGECGYPAPQVLMAHLATACVSAQRIISLVDILQQQVAAARGRSQHAASTASAALSHFQDAERQRAAAIAAELAAIKQQQVAMHAWLAELAPRLEAAVENWAAASASDADACTRVASIERELAATAAERAAAAVKLREQEAAAAAALAAVESQRDRLARESAALMEDLDQQAGAFAAESAQLVKGLDAANEAVMATGMQLMAVKEEAAQLAMVILSPGSLFSFHDTHICPVCRHQGISTEGTATPLPPRSSSLGSMMQQAACGRDRGVGEDSNMCRLASSGTEGGRKAEAEPAGVGSAGSVELPLVRGPLAADGRFSSLAGDDAWPAESAVQVGAQAGTLETCASFPSTDSSIRQPSLGKGAEQPLGCGDDQHIHEIVGEAVTSAAGVRDEQPPLKATERPNHAGGRQPFVAADTSDASTEPFRNTTAPIPLLPCTLQPLATSGEAVMPPSQPAAAVVASEESVGAAGQTRGHRACNAAHRPALLPAGGMPSVQLPQSSQEGWECVRRPGVLGCESSSTGDGEVTPPVTQVFAWSSMSDRDRLWPQTPCSDETEEGQAEEGDTWGEAE